MTASSAYSNTGANMGAKLCNGIECSGGGGKGCVFLYSFDDLHTERRTCLRVWGEGAHDMHSQRTSPFTSKDTVRQAASERQCNVSGKRGMRGCFLRQQCSRLQCRNGARQWHVASEQQRLQIRRWPAGGNGLHDAETFPFL